jgi:hypothetical protein
MSSRLDNRPAPTLLLKHKKVKAVNAKRMKIRIRFLLDESGR